MQSRSHVTVGLGQCWPYQNPKALAKGAAGRSRGVFGQTVGDHLGVPPALKSHEASPDAVPIQPSPLLGPSGRAGMSPTSHSGKMLVLCLSPLVRGWALRVFLGFSARCSGMGTRQDPPGQGGCSCFEGDMD